MGLKILMVFVAIILIVIAFGAGLYFGGFFEDSLIGAILSDSPQGNFLTEEEKGLAEECTDTSCLFENFSAGCEESYGEIPVEDQEILLYMEIAGEENGKCIMNLKLLYANGPAAFGKGLEATCWIAPEEVNTIGNNFDMENLDCEGPLYEAAKLIQ